MKYVVLNCPWSPDLPVKKKSPKFTIHHPNKNECIIASCGYQLHSASPQKIARTKIEVDRIKNDHQISSAFLLRQKKLQSLFRCSMDEYKVFLKSSNAFYVWSYRNSGQPSRGNAFFTFHEKSYITHLLSVHNLFQFSEGGKNSERGRQPESLSELEHEFSMY